MPTPTLDTPTRDAVSERPGSRRRALAEGDCWWGGGLFTSDRALWLNHRPTSEPHHDHRQGLTGRHSPGGGGNEPIYRRRLELTVDASSGLGVERGGTRAGFRRSRHGPCRKRGRTRRRCAIVLERRIENLSYREHCSEGVTHEPSCRPGRWMLDGDARGRLLALRGRVWTSAGRKASGALPRAPRLRNEGMGKDAPQHGGR